MYNLSVVIGGGLEVTLTEDALTRAWFGSRRARWGTLPAVPRRTGGPIAQTVRALP